MTEKIHHSDDNRIGSFLVSYETIANDRVMLGALLALCVVLDVENHESGRGTRYIGASELFQPLAEGDEVPEYRIEFAFDQPFANAEWERRRVNSGRFGFAAFRKIIVRVPPIQMTMSTHATRH